MRVQRVVPGAGRLEWPMPRWFTWIWTLIVIGGWWVAAARATGSVAAPPAVPLVAVAVAGRLAGVLVEAAWYAALWRALGRSLPYGWFVAWLVTLTMLDLIGDGLRAPIARHPALATWLAPFAGVGLLPSASAWPAALRVVFGSLGVLTLARITIASILQARATGARLATALALTGGTWLATRVALWWTADLVRGMSPMP